MRKSAQLRREIEDEIAAFSESVDELESTVSEAQATVTASKLHDDESTLERRGAGRQTAAD